MDDTRTALARLIVSAGGDDPAKVNEQSGDFGDAFDAADLILGQFEVQRRP